MFLNVFCTACLVAAGPTEQSDRTAQSAERPVDQPTAKIEGPLVEILPGAPEFLPIIIKNGSFYFLATVNGKPTIAILDPLTEKTLIDTKYASEAGIGMLEPRGTIDTRYGRRDWTLTDTLSVQVGERFKLTGPMRAVDLSHRSQLRGWPVGLIIGRQTIDPIAVVMLFDKSAIWFAPPNYVSQGPFATAPYSDGMVQVSINGTPARLAIDFDQETELELGIAARDKFSSDPNGKVTVSMDCFSREVVPGVNPRIFEAGLDGSLGVGFFRGGMLVLDGPADLIKMASREGMGAGDAP